MILNAAVMMSNVGGITYDAYIAIRSKRVNKVSNSIIMTLSIYPLL